MKKIDSNVRKTILLLIGCVISLIGTAWIHYKPLILLAVAVTAFCVYVFSKAVNFSDSEAAHMEELKRRAQEESDLKLTRELTWWEFLTEVEGRK